MGRQDVKGAAPPAPQTPVRPLGRPGKAWGAVGSSSASSSFPLRWSSPTWWATGRQPLEGRAADRSALLCQSPHPPKRTL